MAFERTKAFAAATGPLAGSFVASVALGWYVGSHIADEQVATLQAQLSAYQTVQAAQLPELSSDLRSLSKDLGTQLKEGRAIKALAEATDKIAAVERDAKLESEKSKMMIDDLNEKLAKEISHSTTLQQQLALERKDFVVAAGESSEIVRNQFFVGVDSVYTSWATVKVLGQTLSSMSVGDEQTVKVGDLQYKLVMTKLEPYKSCTFTFVKVNP